MSFLYLLKAMAEYCANKTNHHFLCHSGNDYSCAWPPPSLSLYLFLLHYVIKHFIWMMDDLHQSKNFDLFFPLLQDHTKINTGEQYKGYVRLCFDCRLIRCFIQLNQRLKTSVRPPFQFFLNNDLSFLFWNRFSEFGFRWSSEEFHHREAMRLNHEFPEIYLASNLE